MKIEEFCRNDLKALKVPVEKDPISRCGDDIVRKVAASPEHALELANTKLHVFPFKDVDSCWRRLYTDAGITRALNLIIEHEGGKLTRKNKKKVSKSIGLAGDQATEEEAYHWLDEVVKHLDMVLIMTGAPLRGEMIENIFRRLRDLLEEEEEDSPPTKRRKTIDIFPSSPTPLPKISHPVTRSPLSLSQFSSRMSSDALKPQLITSSLTHWPALSTRPWSSPSYLFKVTLGGRRLVPVELGRSYTDEGWGQTIIPFRDFMDKYILDPEGSEGIGYLAQHDLFKQIPALRKDIAVPDHCYTDPPGPKEGEPLYEKVKEQKKLEEPLLNAWLGPAGTVSPLHTDPYHNILCQVVGRKYVRLYAPAETHKLYPRGIEEMGIDMSNTSSVPVEMVEKSLEVGEELKDDKKKEKEKFGLFETADYVETILEEGEALYIPVGWWHYVRALTVSFNVSFWWN